MPRSSLRNWTGNLKHIVQYVGTDADLWCSIAYLGVLLRMQCKHCNASSERWKLNRKVTWNEYLYVEMNILMQKNSPDISDFAFSIIYGTRCHTDQQDHGW